MSQKFNVAVLGATGLVGHQIIETLQDRKFPVDQLFALASSRSAGEDIDFRGEKIEVIDVEKFDFSQAHIGLFSAGGSVSEKYAPIAAEAGCVVIDNTSHFRYDFDVPLIVPEVNKDSLADFRNRNIIANPNCSTIQMVVALKPIHDLFKIKKIIVSTYQSTSGAGKTAMDELFHQTLDVYKNKPLEPKVFTKRIAFNLIPHIDDFLNDGNTKEEDKMINETKKILNADIEIFSTCVRVPVFVGHGESVYIETEKKINLKKLIMNMNKFPGLSVISENVNGGYVTPDESAGEDNVFVSRLRVKDDNKMGLWVVADNLRKGAALNTVQIAELLIKKHLK